MKVYAIPGKKCPIRIQMSDDGIVAALQIRGEDDIPFYWLLVSPQVARALIDEQGMRIVLTLPDTAEDQG